ncbi:hypothetical protein RIR_jg38277.t1 [Rhizophagus irregularis DAOM 181602=DAOM 197198]|nr:hypothetical protein RIR_jg38277.t1 [Rhizophagus irregularis DAOM 181602=DAOM 197198]
MVKDMAALLSPKKLLAQHVAYLYNVVLLPRLEFRLQTTLFAESTINRMVSPMLSLIRQKADISRNYWFNPQWAISFNRNTNSFLVGRVITTYPAPRNEALISHWIASSTCLNDVPLKNVSLMFRYQV